MARSLPMECNIRCTNPRSSVSSISRCSSNGKHSTRQHSFTDFLDPYRCGVTPGMPVGSLTRISSNQKVLKRNVDLHLPNNASEVVRPSGQIQAVEPITKFIPHGDAYVHDQTRPEAESALQNSWHLRRTSSTVTARLHKRWDCICAACMLETGAESRIQTFVDARQSDVDGVVEDGFQQGQGAASGPAQRFFKSGRMKQSLTIG